MANIRLGRLFDEFDAVSKEMLMKNPEYLKELLIQVVLSMVDPVVLDSEEIPDFQMHELTSCFLIFLLSNDIRSQWIKWRGCHTHAVHSKQNLQCV